MYEASHKSVWLYSFEVEAAMWVRTIRSVAMSILQQRWWRILGASDVQLLDGHCLVKLIKCRELYMYYRCALGVYVALRHLNTSFLICLGILSCVLSFCCSWQTETHNSIYASVINNVLFVTCSERKEAEVKLGGWASLANLRIVMALIASGTLFPQFISLSTPDLRTMEWMRGVFIY